MEKYTKTRSTKELEDLGWLKRPTAKENYLINKKLQELHPTYESYSSFNYKVLKNKWNSGIFYRNESNNFHNKKSKVIHKIEFEEKRKIDNLENNDDYKKENVVYLDKYKEKKKNPNQNGIKIKKIKPKKKAVIRSYKRIYKICPNCMSTLTFNEVGTIECSGDRLELWNSEFLNFNQLSEDKKGEYLVKFSNPDMFIDLYDKWSYIENGKRIRFECGYSNKLFNPISRFRTTLPDPILVNKIEKSIGRLLTEEEKYGEKEIWKEGNSYFTNYKSGRKKVKIPQIVFPDGML